MLARYLGSGSQFCLTLARGLCDETMEHTADIMISHAGKKRSSFLTLTLVWGHVPSPST